MASCYSMTRIWKYGRMVMFTVLLTFFVRDGRAQESVPEFSVDIISSRSDDAPSMARVDVYTRIPYSRLSFISTANGFTANYEVTLAAIEINDEDRLRNLVQTKIWDGSVVVASYATTQLDDISDFTTQSIELNPGRYVFEFEFLDQNTNQVFVQELPVVVRNFSEPVSISDVTLLESYDADTYQIRPRVGGLIGTDEGGFKIFYEIYSDDERSLTVRHDVIRAVKDGGFPNSPELLKSVSGVDVSGEVVYSSETVHELPGGKTQYLMPIRVEDFKVGMYLLRITLLDPAGTTLAEVDRAFTAHWSGLNAHINDLDDAIDQLEYYSAKGRDLDYIRAGSNEAERYERFMSFWEKRDPTPGTKRNERMEEFYYRVASANRHYGTAEDGWRTDRGFVFVRFGEPDHVERRPHSFDYEPYEIWVYQRIGRQFIFIDKTGFGDFQLLVPVWDERTRIY